MSHPFNFKPVDQLIFAWKKRSTMPGIAMLETERLLITTITHADIDSLHAICSDPAIMKYVGDGQPLTREQTEKWITVTQGNYLSRGYGVYAVMHKQSCRFAGYCGFVYGAFIGHTELVYALSREYWGSGLASEMAGAVTRYGLQVLKLKKIYASIDPENVASRKILLRTGFKETFTTKDEYGLDSTYFIITTQDSGANNRSF